MVRIVYTHLRQEILDISTTTMIEATYKGRETFTWCTETLCLQVNASLSPPCLQWQGLALSLGFVWDTFPGRTWHTQYLVLKHGPTEPRMSWEGVDAAPPQWVLRHQLRLSHWQQSIAVGRGCPFLCGGVTPPAIQANSLSDPGLGTIRKTRAKPNGLSWSNQAHWRVEMHWAPLKMHQDEEAQRQIQVLDCFPAVLEIRPW